MNALQVHDPSTRPPLDVDELLARCLGQLSLVEKVLGRFRETLDRDLEQLEQAVRGSDSVGIAGLAHRIKGTSLTIAAHGLTHCAERLEASVAAESAGGIEQSLADLRLECSRLSQVIQQYEQKTD